MTRKSRASSPPPPAPADDAPLSPGSGAAQNVWLAGLGALASAQAEGSKAFETLVKQGLEMQSRAQQLASARIEAMTDQGAGTPWNRLGGIFEERVARALASMGMPSAQNIAELTARVEALEQALAQLSGSAAPPRGTSAGPPSPARKSRRPAPPGTKDR